MRQPPLDEDSKTDAPSTSPPAVTVSENQDNVSVEHHVVATDGNDISTERNIFLTTMKDSVIHFWISLQG